MRALVPVRGDLDSDDESGSPEDGHLWSIVQRFLDEDDRTEAWLARKIGTVPQTLSSWKLRGVRQLPNSTLLHNLAAVTKTPYLQVVTAALLDIGYVDEEQADRMTRSERWGRE